MVPDLMAVHREIIVVSDDDSDKNDEAVIGPHVVAVTREVIVIDDDSDDSEDEVIFFIFRVHQSYLLGPL